MWSKRIQSLQSFYHKCHNSWAHRCERWLIWWSRLSVIPVEVILRCCKKKQTTPVAQNHTHSSQWVKVSQSPSQVTDIKATAWLGIKKWFCLVVSLHIHNCTSVHSYIHSSVFHSCKWEWTRGESRNSRIAQWRNSPVSNNRFPGGSSPQIYWQPIPVLDWWESMPYTTHSCVLWVFHHEYLMNEAHEGQSLKDIYLQYPWLCSPHWDPFVIIRNKAFMDENHPCPTNAQAWLHAENALSFRH